jgi:uncharacterized repeat protein (TIGR03803 family)
MLAGCGALGALPQTSTLARSSSSTNYAIVYSFKGGSDAAVPRAGLVEERGTLYGTTIAGGASHCQDARYSGCGTVYRVTTDGAERVLHDFSGGSDGRSPVAGLIDVGGSLYGTTAAGGTSDCYQYRSGYNASCGTVFSITPVGKEKVLHAFSGYPDGAYPDAALTDLNGTLYGTTYNGGSEECYHVSYPFSCGTVFSITTAGKEKVLHSFGGDSADDAYGPSAPLLDVKGTLYGTTTYGGAYGYGTVFSITTRGALKTLHDFGAGSDGREPVVGLVDVNGTLYGTTSIGGDYKCGSGETCGTVFSVTTGGKEKVLYSFRDRADGVHPGARLLEVNGTLYGTTTGGSQQTCGSYMCGDGTVFSITLSGTEKVLHYFGKKGDGAYPHAGLIDVNGTLYGTTSDGGAYRYGTVFSLNATASR